EKIPYPICSVVAVFKMLIRILNTLRSRIWDMVFFLFSGYLKSTVGENEGFSRKIWLSRNLNSKGVTFKLLCVIELLFAVKNK
ncbi:hypothetical protein JYQ75_14425, partial [Anaerobutyricum soehngenii]